MLGFPRCLAVATAAGGLAVDRDLGDVIEVEGPLDPAGYPCLEIGDVDPAEDPRVGGLAEAPFGRESEMLEEVPAPLFAVLGDRLVTGHARQHGDYCQTEKGGEGVPAALSTARIMKALKEFHQ